MKRKFRLPIIVFVIISIFALVFSFSFNSPIKNFITNKIEFKAPANWYTDYTYTLNSSARTITLTRYNGNATEVVIGATATIDRVTYNTVVLGNSNASNSLFSDNATVTKITFENGIKAGVSLQYLFVNCTSLKEIVFNDFDTSATTNMLGLFMNCASLEEIDVSMFDTSNVTIMGYAFRDCFKLRKVDLSNWNTSSAQNMLGMFYRSSNIKELNISSFDTSHITEGNFHAFADGVHPNKIVIGSKTSFHIHDNAKGYPALRGVYKKTSGTNAGREIDGIDIMECAGNTEKGAENK